MFSGCNIARKSGLSSAISLIRQLVSKPLRRDMLRAASEVLPGGKMALGKL
jgi:hypothetical protein